MKQSDRELAEMIAKFRTPPGFNWETLANDIDTILKGRPSSGEANMKREDLEKIAADLMADTEYEEDVARWYVEWGSQELSKRVAAALIKAHDDALDEAINIVIDAKSDPAYRSLDELRSMKIER